MNIYIFLLFVLKTIKKLKLKYFYNCFFFKFKCANNNQIINILDEL